jgi:DNA mismatch repair ATPase MutS
MAKIKLKFGENEIEVDSRDFYFDNQTIGEVIENLAKLIEENQTRPTISTPTDIPINNEPNYESLNSLEDVEIFEPEFNEPKPISSAEIKDKLQILEKNTFFNVPRTVTETVQQLREYGWVASPLDVSKALVNMASNREISRNSTENRTHYFVQEAILTN